MMLATDTREKPLDDAGDDESPVRGGARLPEIDPATIEEYRERIAKEREERKAAAGASRDQIREWVETSASGDLEKAAGAINQLTLSGADEAYDVLVRHLEDEDDAWETRNAAISGLAQYGDLRGIELLEKRLLGWLSAAPPKAHWNVIVECLGKAKSPTSVPVLARFARDTGKPDQRSKALWHLG